jgi:hypothetical protein
MGNCWADHEKALYPQNFAPNLTKIRHRSVCKIRFRTKGHGVAFLFICFVYHLLVECSRWPCGICNHTSTHSPLTHSLWYWYSFDCRIVRKNRNQFRDVWTIFITNVWKASSLGKTLTPLKSAFHTNSTISCSYKAMNPHSLRLSTVSSSHLSISFLFYPLYFTLHEFLPPPHSFLLSSKK